MNKKPLKKYIKNIDKIGLEESDRSDLRTSIQEHIENTNTPTNTLWVGEWQVFRRLRRSALVTAMLLFTLGGVSLAAEGSLPGDFLYPIKTNVNEEFMQLASISPGSEAETESELTARRIKELQALADRGNLNENISGDLAAEINQHITSARNNIEDISVEADSEAGSLKDKLSSTLGEQEEVLNNLTKKDSIDISESEVTAIANTIEDIQAAAEKQTQQDFSEVTDSDLSPEVSVRSRGSVDATTSTKDQELSVQSAQELLALVGDRVEEANNQLNAASSTLADQPEGQDLKELLQRSSGQVDAATQALENKNYTAAGSHIRDGLKKAYVVLEILNLRESTEVPIEVITREFLTEPKNTASSSAETNSTSTTTNENNVEGVSTSTATDTPAGTSSAEVQSGATSSTSTGSENQPLSRRSSSTKDIDIHNESIESTLENVESALELPDRRNEDGDLLPSGVPVDGVRERE